MKKSCSCGKTVYELDEKKVKIHDLTTEKIQEINFESEELAESYYKDIGIDEGEN